MNMREKFSVMGLVRHWNRLPPEAVDAPSLWSPSVTQSSAALLHNLLINSGESLFAALDETKGFRVSAALLQSASKESFGLGQGQRVCWGGDTEKYVF